MLQYRSHMPPRLTGPPPMRSRRHSGSREKGTDLGEKNTGEGGVLRLSSSNLSLNAIAAALRASKTSVSDVLRDAAHAELAKVGVTLRLLHVEYREECAARGEAAMSYGRFCKRCRQFTVSGKVVSRVGRKAGRNVKVDWSGPTMPLVDQAGIRVTVLRVIS